MSNPDARYAASMETIWTLWPTRHDSGINRAILRHALRYARTWRRDETSVTDVPTCDHCGAETVTIWIADDEMWRDFNGGDDGIACTDCFVRWAARERGIIVRFRVEVIAKGVASA